MQRLITTLTLLFILVLASSASAEPPQCNDTIDNDGDGQIDYWRALPANNGQQISVGGSGNPFQVAATVRQTIIDKKMSISLPNVPLLQTYGGPKHAQDWNETGMLDLTTLNQVCRILGYATYVSSTCRDNERSHRYPRGKCKFHSPEDDLLSSFSGGALSNQKATFKYEKTWIASITCKDRLPACNDGWDNDADGLTDYPVDTGCAAPQDDNEGQHDTDCVSLKDSSEAPECEQPKHTPTPTPTPTCQPTPSSGAAVRPMLHCVDPVGPDGFVAFFGYRNDSSKPATITVGTDNRFIPSPENRGQPTTFEPGKVRDAVGVFFTSSVSWLLRGKLVTANASAPRCGPCSCKRCHTKCKHYDAFDHCERLSDGLSEHHNLAMKRLRKYTSLLNGQRGSERRYAREMRAKLRTCFDAQTAALEELRRHDWLVCGSDICPVHDISSHTQTISECAKTVDEVSERLAMAIQTRTGRSLSTDQSVEKQSRPIIDEITAALTDVPTVVSKCGERS
jgi:hypothetical protein